MGSNHFLKTVKFNDLDKNRSQFGEKEILPQSVAQKDPCIKG